MNRKDIFFSWFKSRQILIILPFVAYLVGMLVLYLYEIPIDVVSYISIIYLVIFLFSVVIDYIKFYTDTKRLAKVTSILPIDLPNSVTIQDDIYKKLMEDLESQIIALKKEKTQFFDDANDYYTIWTHQIKTPISALKLLLGQEPLNAAEMKSELFKIEQYTNMALGYQRMKNIENDFIFEKHLVKVLVSEAVKNSAPVFISQNTPIEIAVSDNFVITDKKWFVFVLEQILSNALKYSKNTPIKIYMENYYLVIEDFGIGISKENLPLLFKKGFTGSSGRIYSGSTGLGLYLCKKILNKLFLDIKIESKQNSGTKVFISINQQSNRYLKE